MECFNGRKFGDLLANACDHYEKSAPTVCDYCDDLYRRFTSAPERVSLLEVGTACNLRTGEMEGGIWMDANLAANMIYKLMNRLGMPTVGHAGF